MLKTGTLLSFTHGEEGLIFFPCGQAILSLRTGLASGAEIECGSIGSEGGWPIGRADWSNIHARIFHGGRFLCSDINAFEEAQNQSRSIRELFANYSAGLLKATMQLAACNAAHSADQRLARWLLFVTGQADTNVLYTTHDDVASVLGVGRSYVTRMLGEFLRLGAISYQRGLIEVKDATILQGLSCGCEIGMRHRMEGSLGA